MYYWQEVRKVSDDSDYGYGSDSDYDSGSTSEGQIQRAAVGMMKVIK